MFTFDEFTLVLNQGSMVGGTHLHVPGVVKLGDKVVGHSIAVFTGEAKLINFRIRPIDGEDVWTESTDSYDEAFAQFRKLLHS